MLRRDRITKELTKATHQAIVVTNHQETDGADDRNRGQQGPAFGMEETHVCAPAAGVRERVSL